MPRELPTFREGDHGRMRSREALQGLRTKAKNQGADLLYFVFFFLFLLCICTKAHPMYFSPLAVKCAFNSRPSPGKSWSYLDTLPSLNTSLRGEFCAPRRRHVLGEASALPRRPRKTDAWTRGALSRPRRRPPGDIGFGFYPAGRNSK